MPAQDIVVDADGHILEPPDLWDKYLESKYQPHSIKVVRNDKGLECLQYDGKLSAMAQPGFLAALGGMGKEQDQLRPDAERTYVGCAPFGSMDAKERVELLDRENLAKAVLHRSRLIGANFAGADLTGANLNKTDLKNAVLTNVKGACAMFYESDLSVANFTGADLTEGKLGKARMVRTRSFAV